MADHVRTRIRDAIVEAMRGPNGTENVYPSRRTPLSSDRLPAWCIYDLSEDSAMETMGPNAHLQRTLDVMVQGIIQANPDQESIDDTLDEMALDAETWLNADPTLGGLARWLELSRTQKSLNETKGPDVATASIVLTFRVHYRTRAADPSIIN